MGIKFRCPNGHKLNVKSFLAGKRGICPHCGVGVDIPQSNGAPGKKHSGTAAAGSPVPAQGQIPTDLSVNLKPASSPTPSASLTVKPVPAAHVALPIAQAPTTQATVSVQPGAAQPA